MWHVESWVFSTYANYILQSTSTLLDINKLSPLTDVHTHACVRTHAHRHTDTHTDTQTQTHTHTHTHAHTYTHTHTCMCAHTDTYTHHAESLKAHTSRAHFLIEVFCTGINHGWAWKVPHQRLCTNPWQPFIHTSKLSTQGKVQCTSIVFDLNGSRSSISNVR